VNVLKRIRGNRIVRLVSLGLTILVALLAAAIVVSITVDLGPAARNAAETYGSKYIERPLRIGSLSIHLFTGKVVVEDLRIDGVHDGDRPFFVAKQLRVGLDWLGLIARKPDVTVTSVEMTDWRMLVEKWENLHNFPKFTRDDNQPRTERKVTVTLKYLRAWRGEFSYEDHDTPWSIVCRNLDINIGNLPGYHGTATFTGGTVKIQQYEPMWANMKAQFVLDGPRVRLGRIDLETDGATSIARGEVDLAHWPEQTFLVESRVNFPRMRQLFFTHESWDVSGEGNFSGTFHLFKGGRDLSGTFSSPLAGVNDYRFPSLYGALRWTPTSFEVAEAGAKFLGGDARFSYSIKPLGAKTKPTARFDASVDGLDLVQVSDFEELRGLRFAGSADWHNLLEWPLGRFADHRGEGHVVVTPPSGVDIMTPDGTPNATPYDQFPDVGHSFRSATDETGSRLPPPLPTYLPIGGDLTYRFGPDDVTIESGTFATEGTHVTFQGTTAWGTRSHLPFHVTSRDWQESDQVLVGIMNDFGSHASAVAFGGRGEFDGVMTGAFREPRVEGSFSGKDLRAWDTAWGDATGRLVIENSYVTITGGRVLHAGSEIFADGLFSLGYPRADGGEEIDARFRIVRRDLESLRHAFQIDDYPVTGFLTGEFHLTGAYERPSGFGGMTIDEGVAYGEPFEKATASLRFVGNGVRLDSAEIAKAGGTVTGAAFVGWDSTYSFNADGRRIPVARIAALTTPRVPLTGVTEFTAGGQGTFDVPRYDVRFRISDLVVGEERVGQLNGTLALRGKELTGDIDAASPRLGLIGTGRIALTPRMESDITFRFHDTSLDPYVRLFEPRLSPYTTATIAGSVHVVGELAEIDRLLVDATVDSLEARLFDYALRNAGPIRLALDEHRVKVEQLQLVGVDTRLGLSGTVDLHNNQIALQAAGDANLGILQGFFPGSIRGSGRAELSAAVNGPIDRPLFSGSASIADGRIRHFSLPNALDAINGTVFFDARGIRLDDVKATMGGGRVEFGGRIGFEGYVPGDVDVTVRGEEMHLRYPEGIRSIVDADLALRGNYKTPTLSGIVTVKNAVWNRRIDTPGSIFDIASRRRAASAAPAATPAEPGAPPAVPLRFDLQILVPSTLRIDNNLARMVANADLSLRGTYDRPVLLGHADIERGEVTFEGRRYRLTHGSIEFMNPNKIEPFFDVEAETNVRVPYQTYRVTVGFAGTSEQLRPTLSSDPPLPTPDVLALLFSDVRRGSTSAQDVAPELRALQNPTQVQTDILAARATQAITGTVSSEVGKVVEQTFGVDTFQLTPSFIDPYAPQASARLNPTARVTIGKRISDRVYLTFSRSLGTTINDQIVLLEYEAGDRLSWILSRNEDQQTYALEFRVRHTF
jgi:hypothetical protein